MKSVFRMRRGGMNTSTARCFVGSVRTDFAVYVLSLFRWLTAPLTTLKGELLDIKTRGLSMKKGIHKIPFATRNATPRKAAAIFSRLSLAASILLLSSSAISFAQAGFAISGQAITPGGTPAAGARITVCPYTASGIPCSPQSSIYSNINLTGSPLPQPYASDQHGNYTFYVAPYSSYLVQIAVNQTTTYSYVFTAATNSIGCTTTTDGYFQVSNAPGCVDTYADYGETNPNVFTFNDSFAVNATAQTVGETYDPGNFVVNVNDPSGLGGGNIELKAESNATDDESQQPGPGGVFLSSSSDTSFSNGYYEASILLDAEPATSSNNGSADISLTTCREAKGGTLGSSGCNISLNADAEGAMATNGGQIDLNAIHGVYINGVPIQPQGVFACDFPGADLGAKIIAAYNGASPAIIIVQPCASWTTPLTGLPIGDALYLQAGNYTVPGGNKLLGNNQVYGDGFGVTTLNLQNSDSSGMMWQMSDGTTFAASNVSISGMTLNGNRTNQSVTAFGTGLVTVAVGGTYTAATNSNIQIAAQFIQCKVNCIASVTSVNQPFVTGLVMDGSHINGSGQGAVYLQGVSAPTWHNIDISNWGLDTANSDAIFSTGQVGSSGIGYTCPFTPQGGQWIGGVLNNTGNATKFGIEETTFGPSCNLWGGTIQGITSYGAPNGSGGNGFSVTMDQATIVGNSLIPPPGVTQTGFGGMETALTSSIISSNTIKSGGIIVSRPNYSTSADLNNVISNNVIKSGPVANPIGLDIGGGNGGITSSHYTITDNDVDVSGWTGANCNAILIGTYAGVGAITNDLKIQGNNIHQDTGIGLTITSGSLSGNTLFMNGSFPNLASGTLITFTGFSSGGAFLNGQPAQVSATGLSGTTFQAAFTHANVATLGSGTASGQLNTCHGVYSAALDGSTTLQITGNTFTGMFGGFGDQIEPSVGMTDIDYQNNTLRGGTPIYDNTPPATGVVIRQYGNTVSSTDTGQSLNGNAVMDYIGQLAAPGGVASGSLTVFPQISNPIVGQYDGNQACSGGGSLTSWADQSGNGNTLAEQGASGTCVTSALNGLAAVLVPSGSNNGFVASGITFPQQFPEWTGYNTTLVLVYKKTVSSTGFIADLGTNPAGSTQTGFIEYSAATTLLTANNGQSAPNNTSATVPDDGGWHIAIVTNQWGTTVTPTPLGTQTLYFDGAQVGQTTALSVPVFATGIDIGGSQSSGDNSAAIEVAYAVVYGGTANAAQVKSIETYFSHKFALPQTGVWYIDTNGNATVKSVTTPSVTDTGLVSSGVQCTQSSAAGLLSGTGSPCSPVRAGSWSISSATTVPVTFFPAMTVTPTSCSVTPSASAATTGTPFATSLATTGFTVNVPISGTLAGTYQCVVNNAN